MTKRTEINLNGVRGRPVNGLLDVQQHLNDFMRWDTKTNHVVRIVGDDILLTEHSFWKPYVHRDDGTIKPVPYYLFAGIWPTQSFWMGGIQGKRVGVEGIVAPWEPGESLWVPMIDSTDVLTFRDCSLRVEWDCSFRIELDTSRNPNPSSYVFWQDGAEWAAGYRSGCLRGNVTHTGCLRTMYEGRMETPAGWPDHRLPILDPRFLFQLPGFIHWLVSGAAKGPGRTNLVHEMYGSRRREPGEIGWFQIESWGYPMGQCQVQNTGGCGSLFYGHVDQTIGSGSYFQGGMESAVVGGDAVNANWWKCFDRCASGKQPGNVSQLSELRIDQSATFDGDTESLMVFFGAADKLTFGPAHYEQNPRSEYGIGILLGAGANEAGQYGVGEGFEPVLPAENYQTRWFVDAESASTAFTLGPGFQDVTDQHGFTYTGSRLSIRGGSTGYRRDPTLWRADDRADVPVDCTNVCACDGVAGDRSNPKQTRPERDGEPYPGSDVPSSDDED